MERGDWKGYSAKWTKWIKKEESKGKIIKGDLRGLNISLWT